MQARPTKVLLVAPSFGDFGGIEAFLLRLARIIDSADDLELTICLKRVTTFELEKSLTDALEREQHRVVFVDRASRDLVRAIRGADVVHSHNPSLDTAAIAAALRKPHAMTIHARREHRHTMRGMREWIAVWLPDRRLYNSDFTWRTWEPRHRRRGSDKLPVLSVLPTGIVDPCERNGFAFAGRWVPDKGLDVLIDAYDRARIDRDKWPLVLVGDGELRPSIEREILRRGIDTIEMPGHVSADAHDAVIRNARWMLIPSNRETLGFAAIEARHVGVPCIVTRVDGMMEAAGAFSLSCEPADPAQLAQLIEFAAAMGERTYEWLAEATRRELLAELRPMELYLDLYRDLASR